MIQLVLIMCFILNDPSIPLIFNGSSALICDDVEFYNADGAVLKTALIAKLKTVRPMVRPTALLQSTFQLHLSLIYRRHKSRYKRSRCPRDIRVSGIK